MMLPFKPTPFFANKNRAFWNLQTLGWAGALVLRGLSGIANGQPIIASIRFESGTFPSNVMDQTNGHLVVIRGLTPGGDAVMNDSASKERGEGIVYRSEELARAWLRHGGVAYIIRPMDKKTDNSPVSAR